MGLFFDHRQYLGELKKLFLLEKRVEKLEILVEQRALGGEEIKEKLQKELFSTLKEDLSQFFHQSFSLPEVGNLREKIEFVEYRLQEVEKLWEQRREGRAEVEVGSREEVLEQLEEKIRKQVLSLLSSSQEERAPKKGREEDIREVVEKVCKEYFASLEEWIGSKVEKLWQEKFFREVEQCLEKQNRKIKRLERKLRQLFFMLSHFDDEEEEEEDFFEPVVVKKRRKKKRLPAREEKPSPPLDPTKSAAIESLFQMNLDLQKNLIGT